MPVDSQTPKKMWSTVHRLGLQTPNTLSNAFWSLQAAKNGLNFLIRLCFVWALPFAQIVFFLFEIWNILIESSALSGGIIKHDSIIRCSRSNSMESFSPGKKIQARHPARGSKIVKFIWPCDYLFISTLHISASGSYSMHFSTPHGIQCDNKWFENKWFECWINWDEAHVSGAGSCFLCCSCCCCCVRTREGISWPDLQRYSQNS